MQYAKAHGATVVAVDLDERNWRWRGNSAPSTWSTPPNRIPQRNPKGGADAAIALAVTPRPFEQAFDSLARGGTLVMVALPPDNYVKLPIFGRTRVLRETRPLEEINDAFDDVLHARNKHPRVVLTV